MAETDFLFLVLQTRYEVATVTNKSYEDWSWKVKLFLNFTDVIKSQFLVCKMHTSDGNTLITSPIVTDCQEASLVQVSTLYYVCILRFWRV